MKRVFWILFFLVISLCHAQATNTDEMLAPLDSALSRRDVYMHRKELRLTNYGTAYEIRVTEIGDSPFMRRCMKSIIPIASTLP